MGVFVGLENGIRYGELKRWGLEVRLVLRIRNERIVIFFNGNIIKRNKLDI